MGVTVDLLSQSALTRHINIAHSAAASRHSAQHHCMSRSCYVTCCHNQCTQRQPQSHMGVTVDLLRQPALTRQANVVHSIAASRHSAQHHCMSCRVTCRHSQHSQRPPQSHMGMTVDRLCQPVHTRHTNIAHSADTARHSAQHHRM